MKEITKSLLKDCASNLMFDMEDKEYETLLEEFQTVTNQLSKISDIEGLENVVPMTFPFVCTTTFLREDNPEKVLTREEALSNAKDILGGQIRLPKVVK